MSGRYLPTYDEIRAKVVEQAHVTPRAFDKMVEEYRKKYPKMIAKDKTLIAFLLARDLDVEIRVKKFHPKPVEEPSESETPFMDWVRKQKRGK